MIRKIYWGIVLPMLCSVSIAVAQDDGFDLDGQRGEKQEVNMVPGHKVDHKGLILNPTPQEFTVDWENKIDISNGFSVRDQRKRFANDVDFLQIRSKKAVRVTIDFGEKVAGKSGVQPLSGAYALVVDKAGVKITGYDERGAFYGLQTLRQLIQSSAAKGGHLPYLSINDYPDLPNRGVVEGFYGTPWSHEVRMSLIDFYGKHKMNVYVYGPKDDPYHSSPNWRMPYPADEARKISELIQAADAARVDFVWAIHPGQDIKWNEEDYHHLVHKFELMYDLGVRHFAIFFDDISGEGTNPYKQTELLNRLTDEFVRPKGDVGPLTVCPTDYSQMWANPSENGALAIYGKTLYPEIKVFWTGEVVCSDLTPETLEFINSRIKRPAYFWWNFPVTDYARHILMQGPTYGLDTQLTRDDVAGVLSNPMEHGTASQLALYGVADYSWNVSDFNPIDNWERAIVEVVPEAPEAYRTFAIHSTDTETGYRRIESWETETFDLAHWDQQLAEALNVEFAKIEEAARHLLTVGINPLLLEEVKPWLLEFEKLGIRGRRAIELGQIFRSGDNNALFWSKYLQNQMSEEEVSSFNAHRSGTMKLHPFYDKMMADLSYQFLYKLSNKVPKDYIGISSFPNSGSPLCRLMLDGNEETHYTSSMAQRPDDWIGVDLRAVRSVQKIDILQGRNSTDDVDFFDHATLEYSTDGATWHTLIPEMSDRYEVHWEGAPIEARYVRLKRLESERRNYASMRSFAVNSGVADKDDDFVLVDSAETPGTLGLSAIDQTLSTAYALDGMLTLQLATESRDFVVLLGKVTTPLSVLQINDKGEVVAEDALRHPYNEIQKVSAEVTQIAIKGQGLVYEVIAR